MNKIFCAQPLTNYDWLFPGLRKMDRVFVDNCREADVVFFEARVGFDAFDDANLNLAIERRLPVVVFDYNEYHACGKEMKSNWFEWYRRDFEIVPDAWSSWMRKFFAAGLVRVYFLKYMQASETHPAWVYPIDYAYRPEWEQPEETLEQFVNRPYDVCLIGMSSQPKATSICHFIESRRLKVLWEWYQPYRYPWHEWVNKYRQAKFFLESEGWGPSDKPAQLAWVAAMLRQNADYRWAHDWVNGKDCVNFGDFFGRPSVADIDMIQGHCRYPEALYRIYLAGRETLRTSYTEQAVADYVKDIIERHGL